MKSTKLNWKLIAGVDVDALESNLESTEECGILQETLSAIAFCNPVEEFPEIAPMPIELLKVFRMAQLTVRYLLRSQDMLTQALTQLTQDNQRAHGELEKVSKKCIASQQQIKTLKVECKKRKQTIEKQQSFLLKGEKYADVRKCADCGKTFINETFLKAHQEKRHPKRGTGGASEDVKHKITKEESMKSSIQELKKEDVEVSSSSTTSEVKTMTHKLLGELIKRDLQESFTSRSQVASAAAGDSGTIEELRFVIKKQELEIQSLQEKWQNLSCSMEREEGKLTSQERFWQARLLSKEAEYRRQLTAIHQQLEALKDTTNHAKADLDTSQSVPKHNKESENAIVPPRIEQTQSLMPMPKLELPPSSQPQPFTPSQEGVEESQERPDKADEYNEEAAEENDEDVLHEYDTIQSLLEDLQHQSKWQSVDDIAESNPDFLAPYKLDALRKLESLLSKDFGIHWYHAAEEEDGGREGISDLQLRQAMIQIKDDRRRDHIKDQEAAKVLWQLRKQCKNEVEELLQQSQEDTVVHQRECKTFSRRMTSIRKSLLSLWRRRRRNGGFAPGHSSNLVNSDEKAKGGRRRNSSQDKLNEKDEEDDAGKSQIQKCQQKVQSNVYVDVHEAWSHHQASALPVPAPRSSKDLAGAPNKNEDNIVQMLLSESEGGDEEIANGNTAVEVRKQAKIQRVSSDDLCSSFDEEQEEEDDAWKVFPVKLRQPVPGSKIDILKSSIEKQMEEASSKKNESNAQIEEEFTDYFEDDISIQDVK